MQGTMIYGPRDIRFEDRPKPKITKPTDAIIRLSATCICGSDLWPYRGIQQIAQPTPMGHEYCGVVEEVGREVRNIKPGQFVVGSFATSDNSCVICQDGYQSSCVQREFMSGAQASVLRVPLADLVATSDLPPKELIPSLLATSDVLGTGCTGTFRPTTGGTRTGSLVLVSNSYNSPQSVSLAGTGGVAQATTSATSLTFGTQGLNDTSAAKKVTLTNKNSTAITLFGNTITGTNASAFAISATTCSGRC